MMNLFGKSLPALVLAVFALGAQAADEPNVYDIELVVFLNNTAASSSVERPDSERVAKLDRRLDTLFQRTGDVLAQPIRGGHLGQVADRLGSNPNYVILQHVTWRQQVDVISEVPFVDVSALGLGEQSGLRGLVRFYHSPLLYVDVFLKYVPLDDPLAANAAYGQETLDPGIRDLPRTYFLDEKRRVKLKELHYLDHPKLGAILTVWPVDNAAKQSTASTAPAS